MQIIDAHLHFSHIDVFHHTARTLSYVEYTLQGLHQEFTKANIALGIAMGVTETAPGEFPDAKALNPMGNDLEANLPECLLQCIGINPGRLQASAQTEHDAIETSLQQDSVIGMKLYPGYYPFYVTDRVYAPVYELAKIYNMPIVIHCGDTWSERGLLKYAHPLTVDELAVTYRQINFVIAHMGDPWIMETAELAYKNSNVFVDMSGLVAGDADEVERVLREPLLMDYFKRGPVYTNNYEKYLFGSDWPLVPIAPYVRFIRHLTPESHYEKVFFQNALRAFPKLRLTTDSTDY
jgi:predicted TIM-barrel fold metal-dependent hydrolase